MLNILKVILRIQMTGSESFSTLRFNSQSHIPVQFLKKLLTQLNHKIYVVYAKIKFSNLSNTFSVQTVNELLLYPLN